LGHLVVKLTGYSLDTLVLLLFDRVEVLEELITSLVPSLLLHSSILKFDIIRNVVRELVFEEDRVQVALIAFGTVIDKGSFKF